MKPDHNMISFEITAQALLFGASLKRCTDEALNLDWSIEELWEVVRLVQNQDFGALSDSQLTSLEHGRIYFNLFIKVYPSYM